MVPRADKGASGARSSTKPVKYSCSVGGSSFSQSMRRVNSSLHPAKVVAARIICHLALGMSRRLRPKKWTWQY